MFRSLSSRYTRWLPEALSSELVCRICHQTRIGTLIPQLTNLSELCMTIESGVLTKRQVVKEREELLRTLSTEKERADWVDYFDAELQTAEQTEADSWLRVRSLLLNDVIKQGYFEDDALDCRVEVKQGAGGQEANAFASELFQAYRLFTSNQGFNFEDTANLNSEVLCAKVTASHAGRLGPYSFLKFEHGIHRSQTWSKDKPHTVAASVAIMPIRDIGSVEVKSSDLHIIQQRSCAGPGGQGLAAANQAIRMTHIPSGISVYCTESRSHLDNRKTALDQIKHKLAELIAQEKAAAREMNKKSALGSGVWAEKIRAYNMHRDEATDLRLPACKFRDVSSMLYDGDFLPIVEKLREQEENDAIASFIQSSILSP